MGICNTAGCSQDKKVHRSTTRLRNINCSMEKAAASADKLQEQLEASAKVFLATSKFRSITIPEAMRIVRFQDEQVQNRSLQQRVRRLTKKGDDVILAKRAMDPPPTSIKFTQKKLPPHDTPSRTTISELTMTPHSSSLKTMETLEDARDIFSVATPVNLEEQMVAARTILELTKERDSGESRSTSTTAIGTTNDAAASLNAINPERKRTRRTSHQTQEDNAKKRRGWKNETEAMKQITTAVTENWRSHVKGSPTRTTIGKEVDRVNQERQSNVNRETAHWYIRDGRIGESPDKRGPKGKFDKHLRRALQGAYVTFLKLKQIQGDEQLASKQLQKYLFKCVKPAGYNIDCLHFIRKFDKDSADLFVVDQKNNVKKRRMEWTTYSNIALWFDIWEEFLIEKGFGRKAVDGDNIEENGSVVFFDGQKRRIINIDETDLSLDRTDGKGGGRQAVVRVDPLLPNGAERKNKSSDHCTMLTGSNAAGEPIPPHAQFKSTAQARNQKIDTTGWKYLQYVCGQYGHQQRARFLPTVAMNEKGGMNADALFSYFKENLALLFPNASDTPGHRVVVKIDSGPGRMNENMLLFMRARDFYLFPCVPNTTQVTQETDQNYGQFKSVWRNNLDRLANQRFSATCDNRRTINMSDVWLLLFGGKSEIDGIELHNAFEEAFNEEKIA